MGDEVELLYGEEQSGAEFCKKCKSELAASRLSSREEKLAFTAALVLSAGSLLIHGESVSLTFQTQNSALVKAVNALTYELVGRECAIEKKGSKAVEIILSDALPLLTLCGVLSEADGSIRICERVSRDYFESRAAAAFVRGAFLGSGSISLGKKYHLECAFGRKSIAEDFVEMLANRGIAAKTAERNYSVVAYVKDSDAISDVLALMGATKAVLSFNEIIAARQMNEHVNRQKNCDVYNIDKQVEASLRLCTQLLELDLCELSKPLSETARARLEHPDYSYAQLSELLGVSKSGLKNRLKKLELICMQKTGRTN